MNRLAALLLLLTIQTAAADTWNTQPASPWATVVPVDTGLITSRPYSCRLLDDERKKCAFGSCDQRVVERLTKECLIAGGNP